MNDSSNNSFPLNLSWITEAAGHISSLDNLLCCVGQERDLTEISKLMDDAGNNVERAYLSSTRQNAIPGKWRFLSSPWTRRSDTGYPAREHVRELSRHPGVAAGRIGSHAALSYLLSKGLPMWVSCEGVAPVHIGFLSARAGKPKCLPVIADHASTDTEKAELLSSWMSGTAAALDVLCAEAGREYWTQLGFPSVGMSPWQVFGSALSELVCFDRSIEQPEKAAAVLRVFLSMGHDKWLHESSVDGTELRDVMLKSDGACAETFFEEMVQMGSEWAVHEFLSSMWPLPSIDRLKKISYGGAGDATRDSAAYRLRDLLISLNEAGILDGATLSAVQGARGHRI